MIQYPDKLRKGKTISHEATKMILKNHGLSMTINARCIRRIDTDFYSYFGIKKAYNYNNLMEWLGY